MHPLEVFFAVSGRISFEVELFHPEEVHPVLFDFPRYLQVEHGIEHDVRPAGQYDLGPTVCRVFLIRLAGFQRGGPVVLPSGSVY